MAIKLIVEFIIITCMLIAIIGTCIVNLYILKALKSVAKALDSFYSVVESIDSKLSCVKNKHDKK